MTPSNIRTAAAKAFNEPLERVCDAHMLFVLFQAVDDQRQAGKRGAISVVPHEETGQVRAINSVPTHRVPAWMP